MRDIRSSHTLPFRNLAKQPGYVERFFPFRGSDILPLPLPFDSGLHSDLRSLGRIGELEVVLATPREIKRAQRLRYKVFYKEGNAIADAPTLFSRRDRDRYDSLCDHLIVFDHTARLGRKPKVVGTCRLLRQSVANAHGGFYSAQEFDVTELTSRHPQLRFLELGRFCVLESYRGKRTAELLWQGIWRYIRHHRADVLIGCGSLEGTDVSRLALPLAYLHHFGRAPDGWRTEAGSQSVSMDRMPKEAIDLAQAKRELPPLLKAYLRLGAFVGDGAAIDDQFGTTDVLIMLPVASIGKRYIKHFSGEGADAAPALVS